VRTGALLIVLILVAGCSSETWQARGVVRGVAPAEHQVSIEHGEIEGLMTAMTMELTVYEAELFEGLLVGAVVDFTLRRAGNGYALVKWSPAPAGVAGLEP
jgi:Cu/Ag efflux protein CusF